MERLGIIPIEFNEGLTANEINLKQHFLFYDKLAFGTDKETLERLLDYKIPKFVEWKELIDKKVAISFALDKDEFLASKVYPEDDKKAPISLELIRNIINDVINLGYYRARYISAEINQRFKNYYAFPIAKQANFLTRTNEVLTTREEVINVLLSNFPVIDETISWDRIIDFKQDEDSRLKLLQLLNWSTEIAKKGNLTEKEIIEKIEFLIMEYENALKYHKLKYTLSRFQTFMLGAAEILENLAKLKFSSVVKVPFEIKRQHIEMLEKENQLPGKELAYFVKTREQLA